MIFFVGGCSQALQRQLPSSQEIIATDVAFDLAKGEIRYTLPKDALVRLRIGISNGGALLRTLIDWEPRTAGPHVETWDKKDDTGKVSFIDREDIMAVLASLPLDETERAQYKGNIRGFRKSPRFEVTFPDSQNQSTAGEPILKGKAAIRAALDAEDKLWLTETRYEEVLFLDEVYLTEWESGVDPFNYQLDTAHLNNGFHTLTVNLASFAGDIATKSYRILVNN